MQTLFALLNMLGVAGVGTYMSGRKRMGLIQIILSLSFFALTLIPFMYFCFLIKQHEDNLFTWYFHIFTGESLIPPEYYPPFLLAAAGMLLFGCNLLWSLTTTSPLKSEPPPLP